MNLSLGQVPFKLWAKAWTQWTLVGVVLAVTWLLAVFPMGILVALFCKPSTNFLGETELPHKQSYIDQGSSGTWKFLFTDLPVIKWWANLEDGQAGEDSGRWSASRGGNEYSFLSKWLWAIRNPFNYFKRTSRWLACYVNDCVVSHYGSYDVSDKVSEGNTGGYFVMAKDKSNGRVYYGYRRVFFWDEVSWYVSAKPMLARVLALFKVEASWLDERCYNAVLGYKIKPSHATIVQDDDDLDKAATMRVQVFSKIN